KDSSRLWLALEQMLDAIQMNRKGLLVKDWYPGIVLDDLIRFEFWKLGKESSVFLVSLDARHPFGMSIRQRRVAANLYPIIQSEGRSADLRSSRALRSRVGLGQGNGGSGVIFGLEAGKFFF